MKIIEFNNKILTYTSLNDSKVKQFLNKNQTRIYFTSRKNFKVAEEFYKILNIYSKKQKLLFLFKNLETKNYNDYPVYMFFYGKNFLYKMPLIELIIKREHKDFINVITEKIEYLLKKYNLPAVISFDNFHNIKFDLKKFNKVILLNSIHFGEIFKLKGKFLWINLSVSKNFRFLNFERLMIQGLLYDPFMNWKVNFIEKFGFKLI